MELPWENKGGGNDLKKYFENVSEEHKLQLFGKFISDFKMFGYTPQDEF